MSVEARLLDRMTDRTRKVMRLAAAFSRHFAHHEVEPQDLLDALAHMGGISEHVLSQFDYGKKDLPKPIADADGFLDAAERLKIVVAEAHKQARTLGHNYVGTEHLLLALVLANPELVPHSSEVRTSILGILGCGE